MYPGDVRYQIVMVYFYYATLYFPYFFLYSSRAHTFINLKHYYNIITQ